MANTDTNKDAKAVLGMQGNITSISTLHTWKCIESTLRNFGEKFLCINARQNSSYVITSKASPNPV